MEPSRKVTVAIPPPAAYSWQQFAGYLLATLLPAAVFLARVKMALPSHLLSLYVLAVILTAWAGGWGPALLCTALSAVGGRAEVHRRHGFGDWLAYGVFVATCLLICWLAREVGKRRAVQRELLENRARLAQALIAGKAWLWEWHPATGELLRSPEAKRLLPELAHIQTAREAEEVMHPEDRQRINEGLRQIWQTQRQYHDEFRYVMPDGSVRWFAMQANFFLGPTPADDHIAGLSMEITERKRAEETLRQAERLSVAGRMAATIAHEINNPLESVLNALYLLERDAVTPRTAGYLAVASREASHIAHIVKQTLGFSREAASPQPVEIKAVLEDVLTLYGHKVETSGVKVEYRFEDQGTIRGFPGELRQVFSNLVINAVEAMAGGGRLVLHVYKSRNRRTGASGVRVSVGDTGPGISAADRRHLFEPFFTTKGERGTGLGLWVTRGIVQKHGGSIRLRSRTGKENSGTCFNVFLPAQALSQPASEDRQKAA
jgi:signal transduction histidine kinase